MAKNRSTGTATDRALLVALNARGRLAGEPFREDGTLTEKARPLARRFDDFRREQLVPAVPAGQDVPDRTVSQYDEALRLKHTGYSNKEAFISLALSNYDVPEEKLREALLDVPRRAVAELREMYGANALPVLENGEDGMPAIPKALEAETSDRAERMSGIVRGIRAHSGDDILRAIKPQPPRYKGLRGDDAESVGERDHTATTNLAFAALGGQMYDARTLAETIPNLFQVPANNPMVQIWAETIESRSCALLAIIKEFETAPLAELLALARTWLPLVKVLTTVAGLLENDPARIEQIALFIAALVRIWGISTLAPDDPRKQLEQEGSQPTTTVKTSATPIVQ